MNLIFINYIKRNVMRKIVSSLLIVAVLTSCCKETIIEEAIKNQEQEIEIELPQSEPTKTGKVDSWETVRQPIGFTVVAVEQFKDTITYNID
jgi:hypothetical protein